MTPSAASRGDREGELDDEWVREFLAAEYPRLVAALTAITGSRTQAEDCVQEALVRAWERADRGERIDSVPAWVAKVALNLTRSAVRRLRSERRARERVPQPRGGPDPDERLEILRALDALPRRQRDVAVLRYLLDLDVAQIATVLAVHEGTVKTSLHRARKSLATALSVQDQEEVNDAAGP